MKRLTRTIGILLIAAVTTIGLAAPSPAMAADAAAISRDNY